MALEFALYENHLTADPTDYVAVVQDVTVRDLDQVIEQITGPGSILKPTECQTVLRDFFLKLTENLRNGEGFLGPYVTLSPSIQGNFDGDDDSFDPERHRTYASLAMGPIMREATEAIEVQKVSANLRTPILRKFFDWGTQTENATLTPGATGEITGDLLKFDPTDSEQGVFLVNIADGTEIKVAYVRVNHPKTIQFAIPPLLPAGSYRLEVRSTVYARNIAVKIGSLPASLVVA